MKDRKSNRTPKPTREDALEIETVWARPPFTPEHEELLEQGLRILARMAVHAYFREQAALRDAGGDPGEAAQEENSGPTAS